jgi:hypothetical protein
LSVAIKNRFRGRLPRVPGTFTSITVLRALHAKATVRSRRRHPALEQPTNLRRTQCPNPRQAVSARKLRILRSPPSDPSPKARFARPLHPRHQSPQPSPRSPVPENPPRARETLLAPRVRHSC